ncbi:MAG: hypothetical protein FWE51_01545 [Coriobacteriia bacterium]|nr:hypothetical protein [Coriobacteriia bacterium]
MSKAEAITILGAVKDLVEVDVAEDIFDSQLLAIINTGMVFLKNQAIPVGAINADTGLDDFNMLKDDDIHIVIAWLHLYCLQRFDRTLSAGQGQSATVSWIDREMTNFIMHLKVRYDNGSK